MSLRRGGRGEGRERESGAHSLTDVWDTMIAKAMNGGEFVRVSQRENEGGAFICTQDDGVFLSLQ